MQKRGSMGHQETAKRPAANEAHPTQFVVRGKYADFDAFAESVRDWNLDFQQLDTGGFYAEVLQVGLGGVQVGRARFNRHLHQLGAPPPGMRTFVLPGDDRQEFVWRGQRITSNRMMVFPSGAELESLSRPGFHIFTISIAEDPLKETAAYLQLPPLDGMLGDSEVVELSPSTMRSLRRRAREICHAVETIPGWPSNMGLESLLPIQLLWKIAATGGFEGRLRASQKRRALERALDYVTERANEPVALEGLCQATGVNPRTLRRAFLEEFGVSPARYLRTVRLQGVRRQLRSTSLSRVKISDIAHQWGFWHMGQFAADYRREFGELPSETVAGRK